MGENASNAAQNGRSMRRAIDQFCRWCIVDPKAMGLGTWREQTKACASRDCPLWDYRPVPTRDGALSAREESNDGE